MKTSSIILIDLLVVVLLVVFTLQIREDWRQFDQSHRAENIRPEAEIPMALPAPISAQGGAGADWTEIFARNPFSFDRNDVPIVVTAAVSAEVQGPKPTLFGTITIGRDAVAMLGPGQAGNRNYRAMRVGETLDGWEVIEIREKSVLVQSLNRRETIIMNDPTAQVQRDYSRTIASAAVESVAPAPASTAGRSAQVPASVDTFPPIPLDGNGQPKKGRWMKTPFGNVFLEDRP